VCISTNSIRIFSVMTQTARRRVTERERAACLRPSESNDQASNHHFAEPAQTTCCVGNERPREAAALAPPSHAALSAEA